MKKLFFIPLMFCGAVLLAQSTYTVSGDVKGLDVGQLYFGFRTPDGFERDSAKVTNGHFTFTHAIKTMEMMRIWPMMPQTEKRVGNGYYPVKSSQFQYVAFPGAKVHFTGNIKDFVNAYPSGDAINDALAELFKATYSLQNESVNLMVKIGNKVITDSASIKAANAKAAMLDKKVDEIKKQFIKDNGNNPAAAWLLNDMMLRTQVTNDEAFKLYAVLDKNKLSDNPFFAKVVGRIEGLKATAIGKAAPSIVSSHTYDGKPFDLASLKGKYVVIDFWGTWCGPCVSGMPEMKKYLDKYKGKLDIVGMAKESDDGTTWRNFLNKNKNYNWHQVLIRDDKNYILDYSVAGFPTKIIVNPEGKIVARYVGEDPAFYQKLDELLSKG